MIDHQDQDQDDPPAWSAWMTLVGPPCPCGSPHAVSEGGIELIKVQARPASETDAIGPTVALDCLVDNGSRLLLFLDATTAEDLGRRVRTAAKEARR